MYISKHIFKFSAKKTAFGRLRFLQTESATGGQGIRLRYLFYTIQMLPLTDCTLIFSYNLFSLCATIIIITLSTSRARQREYTTRVS